MSGDADHHLDRLAAGQYISLTTFKRDGSAVPTPVWVTRQGSRLYVITESTSGKVKRLRNSGRIVVAPCDVRGNVTGDAVEATARLLDAEGTQRVEKLVDAKYGLMAKAFGAMESVRGVLGRIRGKAPSGRIGIEIAFDRDQR